MFGMGLIDELFEEEETTGHVARSIHDELEAGRHASLVWNIYSLRIDPDAGTVVVSDLFDRSEVISVDGLKRALSGRPMASPPRPSPPGRPLGPSAGD